jgi:hypothetical protein
MAGTVLAAIQAKLQTAHKMLDQLKRASRAGGMNVFIEFGRHLAICALHCIALLCCAVLCCAMLCCAMKGMPPCVAVCRVTRHSLSCCTADQSHCCQSVLQVQPCPTLWLHAAQQRQAAARVQRCPKVCTWVFKQALALVLLSSGMCCKCCPAIPVAHPAQQPHPSRRALVECAGLRSSRQPPTAQWWMVR